MDTFMASGTFVQGRKALFAVKKAMQGKTTIDRRSVEKTWRVMVTVVKLCGNPRLNITNSPPCILDILPDTYGHLQSVLDKCNENFESLNACPYFRTLLDNVAAKCRQVIQLFKLSKEAIYDETSVERRSLTKFALVFSHMFSELKALYPNGVCIGKSFPITKSAAAQFWRSHFGNRYCVPWRDFVTHFESEHTIRSNMEVIALKSTIDLTCNDHVTVFEFDVFTLLFQPWSSIVRNWNVLAVTHPGYQAFLTYDEVKDKLLKINTNRVGSYLFRLSCTRLGQWAIGHITPEGSIVQTIPQNKSLIQALVDGHKEGFYLHPMGMDVNPDISDALIDLPTVSIHVTQEQYEMYMEIDSSFELCKICTVNKKDVRVEPCGHLVCADCLEHWLESNGSGCPFCRMEIKSTESVLVHPFNDEAALPEPPMEPKMPPPPPKPSVDDTALPSSSSTLPVAGERPTQRHATFSGSGGSPTASAAAAVPPIPPIPWRKPSTGRVRACDSNPLPPVPPPLSSSVSGVPPSQHKPRAPLPAVPTITDNTGLPRVMPGSFPSIPPIEYESSAITMSTASIGCSSVALMTTMCNNSESQPEYSTPLRHKSGSVVESSNAEYSCPNRGSYPSSSVATPPGSPVPTPRRSIKGLGSPSLPRNSSAFLEAQLRSMGFKEDDIQKAVMIAGNDMDLAMKILESFKSHEKKTLSEQLMDLGYSEADVKKAISVAGENRDLAVMILEQFGKG